MRKALFLAFFALLPILISILNAASVPGPLPASSQPTTQQSLSEGVPATFSSDYDIRLNEFKFEKIDEKVYLSLNLSIAQINVSYVYDDQGRVYENLSLTFLKGNASLSAFLKTPSGVKEVELPACSHINIDKETQVRVDDPSGGYVITQYYGFCRMLLPKDLEDKCFDINVVIEDAENEEAIGNEKVFFLCPKGSQGELLTQLLPYLPSMEELFANPVCILGLILIIFSVGMTAMRGFPLFSILDLTQPKVKGAFFSPSYSWYMYNIGKHFAKTTKMAEKALGEAIDSAITAGMRYVELPPEYAKAYRSMSQEEKASILYAIVRKSLEPGVGFKTYLEHPQKEIIAWLSHHGQKMLNELNRNRKESLSPREKWLLGALSSLLAYTHYRSLLSTPPKVPKKRAQKIFEKPFRALGGEFGVSVAKAFFSPIIEGISEGFHSAMKYFRLWSGLALVNLVIKPEYRVAMEKARKKISKETKKVNILGVEVPVFPAGVAKELAKGNVKDIGLWAAHRILGVDEHVRVKVYNVEAISKIHIKEMLNDIIKLISAALFNEGMLKVQKRYLSEEVGVPPDLIKDAKTFSELRSIVGSWIMKKIRENGGLRIDPSNIIWLDQYISGGAFMGLSPGGIEGYGERVFKVREIIDRYASEIEEFKLAQDVWMETQSLRDGIASSWEDGEIISSAEKMMKYLEELKESVSNEVVKEFIEDLYSSLNQAEKDNPVEFFFSFKENLNNRAEPLNEKEREKVNLYTRDLLKQESYTNLLGSVLAGVFFRVSEMVHLARGEGREIDPSTLYVAVHMFNFDNVYGLGKVDDAVKLHTAIASRFVKDKKFLESIGEGVRRGYSTMRDMMAKFVFERARLKEGVSEEERKTLTEKIWNTVVTKSWSALIKDREFMEKFENPEFIHSLADAFSFFNPIFSSYTLGEKRTEEFVSRAREIGRRKGAEEESAKLAEGLIGVEEVRGNVMGEEAVRIASMSDKESLYKADLRSLRIMFTGEMEAFAFGRETDAFKNLGLDYMENAKAIVDSNFNLIGRRAEDIHTTALALINLKSFYAYLKANKGLTTLNPDMEEAKEKAEEATWEEVINYFKERNWEVFPEEIGALPHIQTSLGIIPVFHNYIILEDTEAKAIGAADAIPGFVSKNDIADLLGLSPEDPRVEQALYRLVTYKSAFSIRQAPRNAFVQVLTDSGWYQKIRLDEMSKEEAGMLVSNLQMEIEKDSTISKEKRNMIAERLDFLSRLLVSGRLRKDERLAYSEFQRLEELISSLSEVARTYEDRVAVTRLAYFLSNVTGREFIMFVKGVKTGSDFTVFSHISKLRSPIADNWRNAPILSRWRAFAFGIPLTLLGQSFNRFLSHVGLMVQSTMGIPLRGSANITKHGFLTAWNLKRALEALKAYYEEEFAKSYNSWKVSSKRLEEVKGRLSSLWEEIPNTIKEIMSEDKAKAEDFERYWKLTERLVELQPQLREKEKREAVLEEIKTIRAELERIKSEYAGDRAFEDFSRRVEEFSRLLSLEKTVEYSKRKTREIQNSIVDISSALEKASYFAEWIEWLTPREELLMGMSLDPRSRSVRMSSGDQFFGPIGGWEFWYTYMVGMNPTFMLWRGLDFSAPEEFRMWRVQERLKRSLFGREVAFTSGRFSREMREVSSLFSTRSKIYFGALDFAERVTSWLRTSSPLPIRAGWKLGSALLSPAFGLAKGMFLFAVDPKYAAMKAVSLDFKVTEFVMAQRLYFRNLTMPHYSDITKEVEEETMDRIVKEYIEEILGEASSRKLSKKDLDNLRKNLSLLVPFLKKKDLSILMNYRVGELSNVIDEAIRDYELKYSSLIQQYSHMAQYSDAARTLLRLAEEGELRLRPVSDFSPHQWTTERLGLAKEFYKGGKGEIDTPRAIGVMFYETLAKASPVMLPVIGGMIFGLPGFLAPIAGSYIYESFLKPYSKRKAAKKAAEKEIVSERPLPSFTHVLSPYYWSRITSSYGVDIGGRQLTRPHYFWWSRESVFYPSKSAGLTFEDIYSSYAGPFSYSSLLYESWIFSEALPYGGYSPTGIFAERRRASYFRRLKEEQSQAMGYMPFHTPAWGFLHPGLFLIYFTNTFMPYYVGPRMKVLSETLREGPKAMGRSALEYIKDFSRKLKTSEGTATLAAFTALSLTGGAGLIPFALSFGAIKGASVLSSGATEVRCPYCGRSKIRGTRCKHCGMKPAGSMF